MQNLNIKMPGKVISIDVHSGNVSIDLAAANEEQLPAPVPAGALEWSHTLLDGDTVTYEEAEKAIAELGDSWRMPTVDELASLVDRSRHDPAIDTEQYPDTRSRAYWTSTPCAWDDAAVWVVLFDVGSVYLSPRHHYACVRAVRSGQ